MDMLNDTKLKAAVTFLVLGIQMCIQYYRDDFLFLFDSPILAQGIINSMSMIIYAAVLFIWMENKKTIVFFIWLGIVLCVMPYPGSFINKQTDFLFVQLRYHLIDSPMLLMLLVVFNNHILFRKDVS